MTLRSVRNKLCMLVVTASLTQGCATADSSNSRTNAQAEPLIASAKSASNEGYVTSSSSAMIMDAHGECVRTVHWDSANSIEGCGKSASAQVGPGSVLVSYNGRALFDFDSTTLTRGGKQQLNQLTNKLNTQDEIEAIEIIGHADNIGPDAYNQILSENRANVVKAYLQHSLQTVTVRSSGMGESAPIADNNTESGRRLNRRVEVKIAALVQ